MTRAEEQVAAMYRHTAFLVNAVQEAIAMLEAPFGANDEIPGTIADTIEILRSALGRVGEAR